MTTEDGALVKRYSNLDTERLLELRHEGGLSALASQILEEEINRRNLDKDFVTIVHLDIENKEESRRKLISLYLKIVGIFMVLFSCAVILISLLFFEDRAEQVEHLDKIYENKLNKIEKKYKYDLSNIAKVKDGYVMVSYLNGKETNRRPATAEEVRNFLEGKKFREKFSESVWYYPLILSLILGPIIFVFVLFKGVKLILRK